MNKDMTMNQLLERIEKLEQAVRDIWASCSCLRKDLDADDLPEENNDIDICYEPEEEEPEIEEPEGYNCEDGCPSCNRGCYEPEEDDPEEIEDHD